MKSLEKWSLFVVLSLLIVACGAKEKVLVPKIIRLESSDQIVALTDSLVVPILYQDIPNLSRLPVKESKRKFLAMILPAVLIAKNQLMETRQKIKTLSEQKKWSSEDSVFYNTELKRFKAKDNDDLLLRLSTHPNSIVLAQAAVESGWGSSRFFKEANNLFGIWAYSKDEPRIAANESDVFLRKYNDVAQSIEDYFVTIGKVRAYSGFRKARNESDNVYKLLPHLKYYSERGKAYTLQLKKVIDQNNLTQFDNYIIDPVYFIEQ